MAIIQPSTRLRELQEIERERLNIKQKKAVANRDMDRIRVLLSDLDVQEAELDRREYDITHKVPQ